MLSHYAEYCYAEYCHAEYCYAEYCHAEYLYVKCNYVKCHYAECRYAECHYAEGCYAECRYAECHSVECRGDDERTSFFYSLSPIEAVLLDDNWTNGNDSYLVSSGQCYKTFYSNILQELSRKGFSYPYKTPP